MSESSKSSSKRITLIKNEIHRGYCILLPETMEELLDTSKSYFGSNFIYIFNAFGGQITDIDVIRDNDVLYVSETENNIKPEMLKLQTVQDWITLNVGGKYFTTSKSTLQSDPDSMLARMFQESEEGSFLYTPSNVDAKGAFLIDRNPTYFEQILNYLRTGKLIFDKHINPEGLLEEAKFFGIPSLMTQLEEFKEKQEVKEVPLNRRDVVNALIRCPQSAELRFQGVNLQGADLSKLDLRNINFKYANLKGCKLIGANLSWCSLERADFSQTEMDGAQMMAVKCVCANFEGAVMRNCNFEDPNGTRANMEGANFKSANLEGSQMSGVNLRVATLKNANLKNCDLKWSELAGADLEFCDLSGSDLHEANLRGADRKSVV